MEEVSSSMTDKVNKIIDILSELSERSSPASPWQQYGCEDKENRVRCQESAISGTPTHNTIEAFYGRVSSFGPGLWSARKVSPLECARLGWQVIERDVLECVTCRQVLCATLPSIAHTEAYNEFLQQLHGNLVERHREACWWRHNPCSQELTQPPCITSSEQLHNLTNAALTLSHLDSALPYLHTKQLLEKLRVDEVLVGKLFRTSEVGEEVKRLAVLLVLCGWSRGHGSYLRCLVCRRMVGLWSLYTLADQLRKTGEEEENSTAPGKRKVLRTLMDSEEEEEASRKKQREEGKGAESSFRISEDAGGRSPRKNSKLEEGGSSPIKCQKVESSNSPPKIENTGGRSPRKSKRTEEGGSNTKKVEEGWNMQLRGRRVSEQSSDDGSSSGAKLRGRHMSEQSSDESGSTQQEKGAEIAVAETPRSRRRARRAELANERLENSSPLIIGSSPSTQIIKVEKKHYFDPLEEHRYWCTWVVEVGGSKDTENTDKATPRRGYHFVAESVQERVALTSRKNLGSSQKYAGNVEGLRSIRSLLSDPTPEPLSHPRSELLKDN